MPVTEFKVKAIIRICFQRIGILISNEMIRESLIIVRLAYNIYRIEIRLDFLFSLLIMSKTVVIIQI